MPSEGWTNEIGTQRAFRIMTIPHALWVVPLVTLLLYVRARRLLRKRRIRPRVLLIIGGLITGLAIYVGYVVMGRPAYLPGVAAGTACGALLGLFSMLGAKQERNHAGLWYQPEPFSASIFLAVIVSWGPYKVLNWHAFAHYGLLAVAPPWGCSCRVS